MSHHFDTADSLQGKRILVVEDDYSVASDICRHLPRLANGGLPPRNGVPWTLNV